MMPQRDTTINENSGSMADNSIYIGVTHETGDTTINENVVETPRRGV